jgi:hypothetical protein
MLCGLECLCLAGLDFAGLCLLPGVDPDAKGKDFIDPLFWVSIVVVFARDGLASREAIGAKVLLCRDMNQLEVEEEDRGNPAVYGCIWLHVGVTEHTFNVLCIHLYNQISDSHNMNMKGMEGAKEPIELNLWL